MSSIEIPKSLLDHLQANFPNKLPDGWVNEHQLGVLQGQQAVIRYLEHQFKRQNPLRPANP